MAGMILLITITHSSHSFMSFMSAGPRVYGSSGWEQVFVSEVLWSEEPGSRVVNVRRFIGEFWKQTVQDAAVIPSGCHGSWEGWTFVQMTEGCFRDVGDAFFSAEGGGAGGDQRDGSNGDRENGGQLPRVRVLLVRGAVEEVRLLMLMKRWHWVHLSWKVLMMSWGRWRSLKVC